MLFNLPRDGAHRPRFRRGLSLAVVLLLTLGAGTLALADEPPPPRHAPGEAPPPGEHGGHGDKAHGDKAHGHGDKAHGHGDAHGDSGHGHKKKVIDNWFQLSGFGKDKPIKNGPLVIALFNFACLIVLLVYFARKPIGGYLSERHNTIKNDLEEAARLREQANVKLEEIEARLSGLDAEVKQIKDSVAKDAEYEKEQIVKAATEEADRIIKQAATTLDREIRRARSTLQSEAIEGALRVAEQIVRKQLSDADRKRLNETYISQLTSSGGTN